MSIQYDIRENSNLAECRRATQPQSQTETKQWEMDGRCKRSPIMYLPLPKNPPTKGFQSISGRWEIKTEKR